MCQSNKTNEDAEKGDRDQDAHPKFCTTDTPRRKGVFMDKALSVTKFGRFNYLQIFLAGLVLLAVNMETCGISFVMPVSQCDMNLSTQEKGILGAAPFLGIIITSHFWGFMADTKGRRCVLQPALLVAFVLTICSSLTDNFYLFVTLRFLNGIFMSGATGTIYAYLGEFHDNKSVSRAIMGSALMYGIACLFIPILAYLVINLEWEFYVPIVDIMYKPWRMFLIVSGLPGLLAGIILIFMPESPKFLLGQGDQNGAIEIIKKVHRLNNPNAPELELFEIFEEAESIENRRRIRESKDSQFPLLKSVWTQTAPLFKAPHLRSTLLFCTLQFLLYCTSNGFYIFFIDILNRMAHNLDDLYEQRSPMCTTINMHTMNTSALMMETPKNVCITKLELETLEQGIILEIVYAIGFGLIGLLVSRVGKFPILFFVLVGSGAGGIVCMVTDIPILQIYSFITLMCCGMGTNVLNASAVEIYPTSLRAMAVCISLMFGRLGGVAGSYIVASLLDNYCETAFYLSAFTVIACGFGAFFVKNIHQKGPRPSIKIEPRLSIISMRG